MHVINCLSSTVQELSESEQSSSPQKVGGPRLRWSENELLQLRSYLGMLLREPISRD